MRLPRIAGIETAVEWIAGGQQHRAEAAFKAGVLDALVAEDKLISVAAATLHRCIEGSLDYRCRRRQKQIPLRHNRTEAVMAFTTAKAMVAAQAGKHYPAPMAAVNTIEKALACDRKGGTGAGDRDLHCHGPDITGSGAFRPVWQ